MASNTERYGDDLSESRPSRRTSSTEPTVLIVEDDDALRRLGKRHLETHEFQVLEAADAAEAIELYLEASPELILLDVGLPDRSGFDVCETIRSLPGGDIVPIIVITGLDDPETISRAYSSGATDFALKPLNWTILCNRARIILQAQQARCRLAASQKKLEKTERIACLGTWEFDIASAEMSWSSETARILGLPETTGATVARLLQPVHPLDRDITVEAFRKMTSELAEIDLEHRVLCSDGSIRSVHHRAQVQLSSAGKAVSVQGVIRDVTDRRRAEEKIQHLANYDLLTGLPNRHMFLELLQGTLARSERSEALTAVVYLDLDRFKNINDTLGPEVGDELLTSVADRLRTSLRRGDYIVREMTPSVARWGGDKFLVLLSDLENVGGSAKAVQRLLRQISIPFVSGDREVFLTATAGLAVHPPDGTRAYELLQHAESAMYHAKELGTNRFQFYSDWMNATSSRKLDIENKLHKAIEREQLALSYQPLLDSHTAKIIGAEALLRWQHPKLGSVSPEEFIPIAEEAGLIVSIGEWVMRTACQQFQAWLDSGMPPIRLSVNLSSYQLREDDFVTRVGEILSETGLDSKLLDVELTERGVTLNDNRSVGALEGLKKLGLRVAVDDFGTGHSALSYLKIFPLDVVKIDRSFVRGIREGSSDAAIISAVIAMAHRLDLEVVAEGVETVEQLEFLRTHECDSVQGFLFAKPLPALDFPDAFEAIDFAPRGNPAMRDPGSSR